MDKEGRGTVNAGVIESTPTVVLNFRTMGKAFRAFSTPKYSSVIESTPQSCVIFERWAKLSELSVLQNILQRSVLKKKKKKKCFDCTGKVKSKVVFTYSTVVMSFGASQ